MEPDHAATLGDLMIRYPEARIVCNGKSVNMIRQFHCADPNHAILVNEGDTISTGRHTFTFANAPMVHWPEVMVSYDSTDKILFSADAFGTFGALNGVLFADELDFDRDWLDEARRYYTNIVGKYGPQVAALLKKAAGLDIQIDLTPPRPVCVRTWAIFWTNTPSGLLTSPRSRASSSPLPPFTEGPRLRPLSWPAGCLSWASGRKCMMCR